MDTVSSVSPIVSNVKTICVFTSTYPIAEVSTLLDVILNCFWCLEFALLCGPVGETIPGGGIVVLYLHL